MPSDAPRRIFVGALPKNLGEDPFREYFEKFGELIDVELMRRPGDNRNRGFGFVKYTTAEVSEKVINMHHVLEGQTLTVNYAKVPLPRDTRRFFIGSINKDAICEDDLSQYFQKYGDVEDCVIMKEKNFGFIALFNSDHSKLDAVLNDTHVINGERLKIEAAKPKPQRNRAPVRSIRDGGGMHRFGGPQRFNPYESGPRGMPPGGPWGGPPHPSMYPPYYPGPPPPGHGGPPMRNPEYETFDVKPNAWKPPGGGRPPFHGPGSQYNPHRDAAPSHHGSGYKAPPSYGNAPPPSSHPPPPGGPGGSGPPNSYTSYTAPPPSSGATGTPPTGYGGPAYNPYNYSQPTYSPQTEAPPNSYQNPPTGMPTNYPNTQPPGQTNYPAPGGYNQPQARPTYSQNTYTSYGQPPTY